MSKRSVIMIVLWSVLAIVLAGILIWALLGHSGNGVFFGFNNFSYDDAASYSIGSAELEAEVDDIEIHWVNGSVTVKVYDGDEIKISENGGLEEKDRLRYLCRDGRLIIQPRESGFMFGFGGYPAKDLEILVPKKLLSLDSLVIEAVSAEIDVSGIVIDSIELETVSGNAELEVSVERFSAESVSGKITIDSESLPRKIDIETVSGNADVTLPADVGGFCVEFDSISGELYNEFSGDAEDSNREYDFESVSGNLTIRKAK